MTDETARPATAPESGTPVPAVVERPAVEGAGPSGPSTTVPAENPAENPRTPRTTMTDTVVAKIAGIAAAGVPGVHRLGGPLDRAVDRAVDGVRRAQPRVLGRAGDDTVLDPALDSVLDTALTTAGAGADADRGVSVVVGEREATVIVELTVEFGAPVDEVAAAVRREVSAAVERMTDLRVRVVDVRVADVHVPDLPAGEPG